MDAEVWAASAAQARVQLLSVKIAAEGVLRQWPDAVYLQMDYSDQEYGALVPVAVLHADGQEFDDDMELWDGLDNGADLSSLVANLSDLDDVWSDYRTHYNDAEPLVGQQPVPGPQTSGLDHPGAHQLGNRRHGTSTPRSPTLQPRRRPPRTTR